MKNKLSILIASFILIATLTINFQDKVENNRSSRISISTLNTALAIDPPEYPHYGNYGRDYHDCSITATATADGSFTWHGITIPVKANVQFSLSCTNCAWDCNSNGANTTCNPADC